MCNELCVYLILFIAIPACAVERAPVETEAEDDFSAVTESYETDMSRVESNVERADDVRHKVQHAVPRIAVCVVNAARRIKRKH